MAVAGVSESVGLVDGVVVIVNVGLIVPLGVSVGVEVALACCKDILSRYSTELIPEAAAGRMNNSTLLARFMQAARMIMMKTNSRADSLDLLPGDVRRRNLLSLSPVISEIISILLHVILFRSGLPVNSLAHFLSVQLRSWTASNSVKQPSAVIEDLANLYPECKTGNFPKPGRG